MGLDSFSECGAAEGGSVDTAEGAIFIPDMTFESGGSIAVAAMAKVGRSWLQSGVKEYQMGRNLRRRLSAAGSDSQKAGSASRSPAR